MNYCFDLDGTICDTPSKDSKPLYHEANPIPFMVNKSIVYLMKEIK